MLLKQLRQFVFIAKLQNISKAAKKLYISQQALSQSLHNFEMELGVKLFERTRQGVTLTDFGKRILPSCEMLVQQVEDTENFIREQALSNNKRSLILIEESCLAPSVPPELLLLASRSNLALKVSNGFTSYFTSLEEGTCNVVYCFRPAELSGMKYIPVVKEQPYLLLNKENPLSQKKALEFDDVLREGLLLPKYAHSSFMTSLVRAYAMKNAYPICNAESPDLSTLVQMVHENVGVIIAPSYLLPTFKTNGLEIRPFIGGGFFFEYGFLVKSYDNLNLNEKLFIQSMLEYYNTEQYNKSIS